METSTDPLQQLKEKVDNTRLSIAISKQLSPLFKSLVQFIKDTKRELMGRVDSRLDSAEQKITTRLAAIREPKDGRDGKDGQSIKGERGEKGEKGDKGDKGDAGTDGRDGKDIDPEFVEGLDDQLKEFEKRLTQTKPSGVFIGPSRGHFLFIDGAKKGLVNTVNLIAGTGVTLSYNRSYGRNDITISAATGAFSIITVTGDIDGVNTTYSAASAPTLVVINGTAYRDGRGVSISGTTITTDFAPQAGSDIYAL